MKKNKPSGTRRSRPVWDHGGINPPGQPTYTLEDLAAGGATSEEPEAAYDDSEHAAEFDEEQNYDAEQEYDAEQDYDAEQEYDAQQFDEDQDYDADPEYDAEQDDYVNETDAASDPTVVVPVVRQRRRRQPAPSTPALSLAFFVGALLAIAGLVFMFTETRWEGLQTILQQLGLAPAHIMVIGVVVAGLASMRRALFEQGWALSKMAQQTPPQPEETEQILTQLNDLADAMAARADRAGDSGTEEGESLAKAVHLLERQDEKINNLSKATKMYGKPLLEITTKISESSNTVSEMMATVNALKIIVEQSTTRLETKIGSAGGAGASEEMEEIAAATRRAQKTLDQLSETLTDKYQELGSAVGEAQQLSAEALDSFKQEVTKGLTAGTDLLTEEMVQLGEKVDGTRAAVTAGVELITSAAGGSEEGGAAGTDEMLAQTLSSIQSELAEITRAVADVQGQPAAAPAPAPAAPTEEADASAVRPDGVPKTGKSEGVMSAIAKLKQMRT